MMLYWDPTYILMLPAIILAAYAQSKVSRTYNKYQNIENSKGYTGAQIARKILDDNGLREVKIKPIAGILSDHYDPRTRVVSLSKNVYEGASLSAAGIAAHECGHAIQHATAYIPLQVRSAIAPVASIASNASWVLIIIGLLFMGPNLVNIGIGLFTIVVLFQLVTLPVEFNASSRATNILETAGLVSSNEINGVKKVLSAAALTYIAAMLTAILQLLRIILISRRRED